MQTFDFFDSNLCTGRARQPNPSAFHSIEDLLTRMGRCGIGRGLVCHAVAREYDAMEGNALLVDCIVDQPSLEPVWAVMPHHTGEFSKPDDLLQQMKAHNVRAVRMFPEVSDHNYSVAEWNCGALFGALERHAVPLFLDIDQLSWNELFELCRIHPQLNVVLGNLAYRIDRNLYPLLERFAGLHVETSGYKVHRGLEEICSRFGAERLIFGSGMPVYSGAAAVTTLRYAGLSEEQKARIAGANLSSLLDGVKYD